MNPPRILVAMPTPHEATRQIAGVLHEEGVLSEFVVPLANTGRVTSKLRNPQWRYELPATSGAAWPEFVTAAAYRLQAGRRRVRGTRRLTGWRDAAMDKAVVRRLSSGRHSAVVTLQGRGGRAEAAADQAGIAIIHQANTDTWSMERQLDALLAQTTGKAERAEIQREFWVGDSHRASERVGRARFVLAESERMASFIRTLPGDPDRVVALGQGVDTDFFRPGSAVRTAGPLRVVQVSRVGRAKGVHITNAALQLVGAASISCTIAGWDGHRVPLLVRESQNVRFAGGVGRSGVRDLLQASDVFVLPTLADSMPRAVLEAMAAGLAVVTTPESGYGELIRHGENGFIVPGEAEAFAEVLIRLANDRELLARVGRAARVTAESNTWAAFGERFRRVLYAELLPRLERTS